MVIGTPQSGCVPIPVYAVGDTMSDLKELLIDLSIAEAPTVDLNDRVGISLGWKRVNYFVWTAPNGSRHVWLPRWVYNTDAALELLPTKFSHRLTYISPGQFSYLGDNGITITAYTLPIAIVIAALRIHHKIHYQPAPYPFPQQPEANPFTQPQA